MHTPITYSSAAPQQGFSLVETLIAMVIFLFVGLGAAYGLARNVKGNTDQSSRQTVLSAAQDVLDTANPPSNLCSRTQAFSLNTTPASTATVSCTTVQVPVGPAGTQLTETVTRVTLTATWTSQYGNRQAVLFR